jgi:hypothetical protein
MAKIALADQIVELAPKKIIPTPFVVDHLGSTCPALAKST